ncbi:hypothetical protein SAVIM40S_01406 [Streptomyces avidinii]
MTARTASAKAMSVAVGTAAAVRELVARDVDEYVDHRGYGHAADGGDHRKGGRPGIAQITRDELALELDAGDEEEDGEEAVGRPVLEREVQPRDAGPMWKERTAA